MDEKKEWLVFHAVVDVFAVDPQFHAAFLGPIFFGDDFSASDCRGVCIKINDPADQQCNNHQYVLAASGVGDFHGDASSIRIYMRLSLRLIGGEVIDMIRVDG